MAKKNNKPTRIVPQICGCVVGFGPTDGKHLRLKHLEWCETHRPGSTSTRPRVTMAEPTFRQKWPTVPALAVGCRYKALSHNAPGCYWIIELIYAREVDSEQYYVGVSIPRKNEPHPPYCYLFTGDGEEVGDWTVDNMYLTHKVRTRK